MHADLTQRAAVATDALAWLSRDGIEEKLLEATADRRTALVRMPPGTTLPVAGGGCLDVLVLDGTLHDGTTSYPVHSYLHDAATTPLATATGCTLFVKQRPAAEVTRWAVDTARVAFGAVDLQGLATAPLHADAYGRVALLRFAPGAALARHRHDLGEEFLVLAGELDDDHGRYAPRWWVRQPPGSEHAVRSATGSTTLAFADHLAARPPGPMPGDAITDGAIPFRLDAVLSHGSKCTVFAATRTDYGAPVAVKVLTSGWKSAELVQRMMLESRLLAQITSPHVVRALDVGILPGGQHYTVMERVAGARPSGPLAPALAVDIATQVCGALSAVHAQGVVHRDVRPANLLVATRPDNAPHVTLLSFSIALQLPARKVAAPVMIGSPPYMPPEQIVGSRALDARADLWALGVTMYELLTGRLPFHGKTLPELAAMITSSAHPPPAGIHPTLAAVIDRCLAKERDRRYATAEELAAALAAL